MSIWSQPAPSRATQIDRPIVVADCVIDMIAAEIEGRSPPQLLVMMTPGESGVFPPIPAELERRFKAVAAQLREQAAGAK